MCLYFEANFPIHAKLIGTEIYVTLSQGLNLGDVQFDGKACYAKNADLRVASPLTSLATQIQITTAMLLTNCVLVTAGMYL